MRKYSIKAMVVVSFMVGYIANDVVRTLDVSLISPAQASVAGMDYRDLRRDRDFKKAVRYVVGNNCQSQGVGEYIYC